MILWQCMLHLNKISKYLKFYVLILDCRDLAPTFLAAKWQKVEILLCWCAVAVMEILTFPLF